MIIFKKNMNTSTKNWRKSGGHERNYQRNFTSESRFSLILRNSPPPPVGRGLLIHEISRSHNDAPHSVGLLFTNDKLVAEKSTWQHTTLTTDRYPCLGGIRTHNLSRRAVV